MDISFVVWYYHSLSTKGLQHLLLSGTLFSVRVTIAEGMKYKVYVHVCIVFLYGTAAWGYLKQILTVAKDTYTPGRQQRGINLPYDTVSLSNFQYTCTNVSKFHFTNQPFHTHVPINAYSSIVWYDFNVKIWEYME